MKQIYKVLGVIASATVLLTIGFVAGSARTVRADGGVAIDETNFPDENFRNYVSENCDTDKDGFLSEDEISKVTSINVTEKNIQSLVGVKYFNNLKELYCINNRQLVDLNLSGCSALKILDCSTHWSGNLEKLDISGCVNLEQLNCENNKLTDLDVSDCAQ